MTLYPRTTVPKAEDRDEWLAQRRPYFNASAAAVLFDRHPHLSASAYTRTKLTGEESARNEAMRRGQHLEHALATWWADRNDGRQWESNELFICGRVMATIDRWGALPGTDPIPLEFKTTNHFTGAEPEEHWYDQCQAILVCTGAPEMFLLWMDASLELRERRVVADGVWQSSILSAAERFMSFIDLGMVPEGVVLDYPDAGAVYPVAEVAKIELDDDTAASVAEMAVARAQRLFWTKREEEAKAKVATFMGSAEVGYFEGTPAVEWRSIKPRRLFNLRRFAMEQPELWESYMEEAPQRRMRTLLLDDGEDET